MYVDSLSKTFLVCLATLVLTACGGGGGGGGGSILEPAPDPGEEGPATGNLELSIVFSDDNSGGILAGNEQATLQAKASEDGATGELVVVFSSAQEVNVNGQSAPTVGGVATLEIIGNGSGTPAVIKATVTLSDGTEITDELTVQMSAFEPPVLELSIVFSDDNNSGGILAGNERATLQAKASEDGATGALVVVFAAEDVTIEPRSASTIDDIATVEIIGNGSGTPAIVTAEITLSDGTTITQELIVQMSSDKPTINLVVRNSNGVAVTEFDSNVELTAEATVVDWDGEPLNDDDNSLSVSFVLDDFSDIDTRSVLTSFEVCPVVGIKEKTDCAFVKFTSTANAGTGDVVASATLNNIPLEATVNVENTGTSGGIPAQDSFDITRTVGNSAAESDTVALEGDEYTNQPATISVDLADFRLNPVPDGQIVQFRTELGTIDSECSISNGSCEVTFLTGEPRSPANSGVSFRNLDDDNCPSNYIEDEQVTVSGTTALTDYRVADVLRVRRNGTATILTEGVNYTVNSNGVVCNSCSSGQILQITYQRLWLDEENDGATAHVMLTPGAATAPFLDRKSTPCFAGTRGNLEVITGSIEPAASTAVAGVGTRFLTELAIGDRIKVGTEVRTVASIASDTSLAVTAAFAAATNDTSPERMAAPAYLGGMGQPYGGRSTILAWTQGEESFQDDNANGEYDFGESFNDLPEAFLDKNEDGVLDDNNGDSASAGTLGPYRDTGLGSNVPANSEARQKNNPYCYGPATIIGEAGDGNDSTEADRYCYQDGGEEEDFIDANGNGVMDAGNGIYNGSRCINPVQNGATVCTTDLVDIRRETQLTLAGSRPRTEFRAYGANGLGGTFGGGEIIQGIENRSGIALTGDAGIPTSWVDNGIVPVTTVRRDNAPGYPMGGAQIDTTVLDTNANPADKDEEVSLFSITNTTTLFPKTQAVYTVSFDFGVGAAGAARTGAIDLFINGVLKLDNCTLATCTVSGLNGSEVGDLLFVVGESPASNFSVVGTISNVQITGTTTGTNGEFRSTEMLVSNNRALTNLTEFSIGENIDSSTVFPGASERKAPSGNVPAIYTTQTSGVFWFTDRFNGQMPDGTKVSLASSGCKLVTVGGTTDTTKQFEVGADVTFGLSFSVVQDTGSGSIVATVTTPIGNSSSDSISCNLLN